MNIVPHRWTYEIEKVHVNKTVHAWHNVANNTNVMWALEEGVNKNEQQDYTKQYIGSNIRKAPNPTIHLTMKT